jgi:hypothetical protein
VVSGRRNLKAMLRRSLCGGRVDFDVVVDSLVSVVGSAGIEGVGTALFDAASLSADMIVVNTSKEGALE